jgi:twitching motility two-component system response regulator PilH
MAQVLIVDDSAMQAKVMARHLTKHGFEVISASSGEEGVEMAQLEMPDIIIMDVVMPGMNGFQATRKITRNKYTEHIPVVLVSTKSQETDRKWGERQGAKGYLVKPVEEIVLVEKMLQLLEENE